VLEENLNSSPIIEIDDLHVHFNATNEIEISGVRGQKLIRAVDGVNLNVQRGEILSLVGESGSGKTTLGRTIVRLLKPTSGRIMVDGKRIDQLHGRGLRELWRTAQMIFQDPYSTFNPMNLALDSLTLPLQKFKLANSLDEAKAKIDAALSQVGLSYSDLDGKHPNQLSGGQRQRLAIARAVIVGPEVIIADEPVSMLDVSLRAGILDLIRELNSNLGVTVVFITHDLAVAEYISNRIAVMYKGRIAELAPSNELISSPHHPYTELLIKSVPRIREAGWSSVTESSMRNVDWNTFRGCSFFPRCRYATDDCAVIAPSLKEETRAHYAACYNPLGKS